MRTDHVLELQLNLEGSVCTVKGISLSPFSFLLTALRPCMLCYSYFMIFGIGV